MTIAVQEASPGIAPARRVPGSQGRPRGLRSKRTPAGAGRRGRRAGERSVRAPIRVALVGRNAIADKVAAAVGRLGVGVTRLPDPGRLLAALEDSPQTVILVPPLPDLALPECCRRIRSHGAGERVPVLVVSGASMSDRQHRALYEAGVTGHFEWPSEKPAFVRALLRCTGGSGRLRPAKARSASLAAKLEEQLHAERETLGAGLRIRVQQGTVFLEGEVDALWKRSAAQRLISSNPEVGDVVSDAVRVPPVGVSDRAVSRGIAGMLGSANGLDQRTLGISVSAGHVTVTGTTENRQDLDRVMALIEQVRGVRSIENLMTISPERQRRDRTVAQRLSRILQARFPRARVEVAVFGGVAVLRGRVRGAVQRRAIEAAILGQPGIRRLVSKIV